MIRSSLAIGLVLPALVTGCTWEEDLLIQNMSGTVVIPREAATREFARDEGLVEVTDVRLIGPVYLGLYPSIQPEDTVQRYPYPEVGPLFGEDLEIGDTYPYGGTTVGNFRSACIKDMTCRVVSGRFVDFEGMASWFADTLQDPIVDFSEQPVTSGEFIRQTCFAVFDYTSDEEIRLTVTEDKNGDGNLDELDLDFVEREDGNFEADFLIWQQEFATNEEGTGFSLWGFMDTPAAGDGSFSTCSNTRGFQVTEYAESFQNGAAFNDILNRPATRLQRGDWVAGQQEDGNYGYIYQDPDDTPELWINFPID